MLLGCVCDDFTGSTDLGNNLRKGRMRVTQYCGVPDRSADRVVEAGVIALKTRSAAVADAITQSLAAVEWLLEQGCRQIYFKYCSTFDSTPDGNIGPVADVLAQRLGESKTVVCPSFPDAGRTVYQGHLFVHDRPLNESGMQNHPLTPMVDSDLRRWLGHQSERNIAHIPYDVVCSGATAIGKALESLSERSLVVVDAISNSDLHSIADAVSERALITGGSGLALGLPDTYRNRLRPGRPTQEWHGEQGVGVVLSGSCSSATRAQVQHYARKHPSLEVRADAVMTGEVDANSILEWVSDQAGENPLVYTSADPRAVAEVQSNYGAGVLANAIENFFSELARQAAATGVRRFVVAGGETSGAVVEGLRICALDIGPEIVPGVPAVRAAGNRSLVLALKSGNFGDEDFFETALQVLAAPAAGGTLLHAD